MDVTYALDLDAPAIGFRRLSSNRFLNLQANRWLVTERAVADFLPMVPRTTRIADWVRTYLDLADRVRDQEHDLEAAFFARGAEFFMQPGNPLKAPTRRRFVSSLRRCFVLEPDLVPFEGGLLPAYELTDPDAAQPPRSTWVVFGGFDSYIEETFPVLAAVAKRGRRVIAFEGPGQGGALEADLETGTTPGLRRGKRLTMRNDWAAPVSAVLDHFDVEEATLIACPWEAGSSCTPPPASRESGASSPSTCSTTSWRFSSPRRFHRLWRAVPGGPSHTLIPSSPGLPQGFSTGH